MMLRRRRLPGLPLPPEWSGPISNRPVNPAEVARLRSEEQIKEFSNAVADFCIYLIQNHPVITNALKTQIYREAIAHFDRRLPAGYTRILVDATIRQELALREDAAFAKRRQQMLRQGGRRLL